MIPELGHYALLLAFALALVQAVVPLAGARSGRLALMRVGRAAAHAQLLFIVLAYVALTWAFVVSDFSVRYVALHSNTATPLIYRITAVWGSHEGSLLLWNLALALWTVAVARHSRGLPEDFSARVLGVLGWVGAGFLAFMLLTSNPFTRLLPAAAEGRDLNPLLQDPGMILHPPLLYMGYVGFSVAFAFAIAALLAGRLDAAWARWSRPWTTAAWVFLTAGIAVGSGWAYYELGWGGWWFWDPVENSSLMPWLLGTALIHSLAVTEKRGAFRSWTVLLAIGTFSLSLLGAFLVRSGVLTSVHAFAVDPGRGMFVLSFLVAVIGSSFMLYAWRAPTLGGGGRFGLVSRDAALLGNNMLLAVVTASVLLGTLYPLFMDVLKLGKISVGPPYFEAVFVPLMTPVVILMMLGTFLRWKDDEPAILLRRVAPAFVMSIAVGVLSALLHQQLGWRAGLGLGLAAWVVLASVQLLAGQLRARGRASLLERLRSTPAAWWGMWLSHLGIGVFIIGVTLVGSLDESRDVRMLPGESVVFAGHDLHFEGIREFGRSNYDAARATFTLSREGQVIGTLQPEKRLYIAQQMPMTEAALDIGFWRDFYVALGEPLDREAWIVHLYYRPFISWIWAGCALMGLGGILAALDRRYRRRGKGA
ncbi:heme lyase CcmF/NrfE family subunit [Corticimicrobacter populi]|uniref:C-type cytochrome biogenesis protein CcmF n=1 Tax=Corticimicrobacter populi TaxID=2175229 RepID=A0A2V1JTN8_9BURK|nr:heme lyase CcmF/NrfE family subunit [Corticimicrobacter populi]PWF21244.1 c-type cytochrome biogenesis protein CcmF [Corticimicrobacter populi]QDQ88748.1 heme lyase CcmF/NrfE family subunit [Alcaligenaceae bacterium SJ-26]